MTLFSAREMADLRDLDESAQQDTCTIVHVTQVSDNAGAWTPSEATTTSTCRVDDSGDTARLFLPFDVVVETGDRITVAGRLYHVTEAPEAHALSSSRAVVVVLQAAAVARNSI